MCIYPELARRVYPIMEANVQHIPVCLLMELMEPGTVPFFLKLRDMLLNHGHMRQTLSQVQAPYTARRIRHERQEIISWIIQYKRSERNAPGIRSLMTGWSTLMEQ